MCSAAAAAAAIPAACPVTQHCGISRITLRHLKLLYVLGQELNLGRAAVRLNMSQPAVSASLRDMEEALGTKLFERTTRKVEVTAAGRQLWPRARRVLVELEAAQRSLEAVTAPAKRELGIGIIPAIPGSLLAAAVAGLPTGDAGFPLRIVEANSSTLASQLASGQLDAILCHMSTGLLEARLEAQILYEETLCLVAASGHALARKKRIVWRDLQAQRWILPSPEMRVRARIEGELILRGMPDTTRFIEASSSAMTLSLLERTDAIAPMHLHLARVYERQGLLSVLPFSFKVSHGQFAMLHLRSEDPHPGIAVLAQALKRAVTDWAA
ncbi:MAG: LysR family transcriptional regulator [Pigmentiphaga sp.]